MAASSLLVAAIIVISSYGGICAQNSTTFKKKVCPVGFSLYAPSAKCYALISTKMTKDAHIAQCSRMALGAFIAAPLYGGEDRFIQNLILASPDRSKCFERDQPMGTSGFYGYFLGAESCERKNCFTFQWRLSGDLIQKMVYSSFGPKEPNCKKKDEYCMVYYYNFRWNDIACYKRFCSVCEYRLQK